MNPRESDVAWLAMPTNGSLPSACSGITRFPRRDHTQIGLSPAHSRATIAAVGRMHPAQASCNRVKNP